MVNTLLLLCISIVCLQLLTAVVLFLLTRTNHKIPQQNSDNQITILIPFHNEEKRINKLIRSLNKVKPSTNFELIFINDHSTDGGAELIQDAQLNNCRVLDSPGEGKKAAISHGIEIAKGELILNF